MLIQNMLKKFNTNDFFFVELKTDCSRTLVVKLDVVTMYDIYNNTEIVGMTYLYKKPLTDFIKIEDDFISALKAKKLSKKVFKQYEKYADEEYEKENPQVLDFVLKDSVSKNVPKYRKDDIFID